MLRPQLTALYTTSLKPTVTMIVAKGHGLAATLSGMDRNRRLTVAAGAVVLLFILWQLFGSLVSLRCIVSCALTSTLFMMRVHHECTGCRVLCGPAYSAAAC